MSANLDNEEHSIYSMPSEMSSLLNMNSMIHSRILKPETGRGGLQVVAETENEPSGFMLDGLDTDEENTTDPREKNIASEENSHNGDIENNDHEPETIQFNFQSSNPPGLDPINARVDSPQLNNPVQGINFA